MKTTAKEPKDTKVGHRKWSASHVPVPSSFRKFSVFRGRIPFTSRSTVCLSVRPGAVDEDNRERTEKHESWTSQVVRHSRPYPLFALLKVLVRPTHSVHLSHFVVPTN